MTVSASSIAKGTAYITTMNLTQLLFSLFFYIFLPRILPTSEVGQVSIVLLAMGIFNTATMLALNSSVIKFVSSSVAQNNLSSASSAYKLAMRAMLMVSIPSLLVSFLISVVFSSRIGVDSTALISGIATGFVLNLVGIIGGALYGLSLFKEVAVQNIIFFASSRILAVALSPFFKVDGVSFGLLLGSLLSLGYSFKAISGKFTSKGAEFEMRKLLEYSLPLYGYNLLALAQGWIDVAVLYSVTYNLSVLGVYYIIVSSAGIVSVLWSPLSSVLFPAISLMHSGNDRERVRETVQIASKLILFIVMPVSLALASASPTALEFVYGSNYSTASVPFSIVSVSLYFIALSSLLGSALQAIGNTLALLVASASSVIVDAAILYFAVPLFSSIGASIARALMAVSLFLILYTYFRRSSGISISPQPRVVAFSVLCAVPTALLQVFFGGTILMKALAEVFVFVFSFLLLTKLLKPINGRERELIYSTLPSSFKTFLDFIF